MSVSASTLEYLELPGESINLPEMAAWSWPRLHTLILYGQAPLASPLAWFRRAPSLRSINVQFDRTVGNPHFILYPRSDLNLQREFPRLQSLTLANPSPRDGILHLLSDVHFLAFPVLPAASHSSNVDMPIWEISSARATLLCNEIPNLVELRISVKGLGFSELVHTISTAFPILEVVELHHYHGSVPTSQETVISLFFSFIYTCCV